MANCVNNQQKNIKKHLKRRRLHRRHDIYAIYCDQDRARIDDLLKILSLLKLRVHCKDYTTPGEYFIDANINNGILSSKCSLLFVSSHFESDGWCEYFAQVALHEYVTTNKKHRIITICLDQTRIPCLGIFQEIPIKNFSSAGQNIIPDAELLCTIMKAMKGPRLKTYHPSLRRCHSHTASSFKRKKKRKLLKKVKKSKFSRFKFTFDVRSKVINFGYVICKCVFNSFLWKNLIKLVKHKQVVTIIQHNPPQNLEHLLKPGSSNCKLEKLSSGKCKYCNCLVLISDLDEHENDCWRPEKCECCGMWIPLARKKKHQQNCIFEECLDCKKFHSPSHDCSELNSITTRTFEDQDGREDFSSLNSVVTPKFTGQPEVKKTLDQLLKLVQKFIYKKNSNQTDSQPDKVIELTSKLLGKLKDVQIIDQEKIDDIQCTMDRKPIPITFSAKSINLFRNFVYAIELHCDNISLFKEQPLVAQIMSDVQPQQKRGILDRFKRGPSNNDSKQCFFALTKDLFKF